MGQHRHLRLARLPDADQDRFPLSRLNPGSSDRSRPRAVSRPCSTRRHEGRTGVALLLFQVAANRAGLISRTRYLYPAHEVEEHAAAFARRGSDHTPRARILRLKRALKCEQGRSCKRVVKTALLPTTAPGRVFLAQNVQLLSVELDRKCHEAANI